MSLGLALSPLLLAAGTAEAPCTPIPGFETVAADERIRWIVIGEGHGSNEIPAIFADAVCVAAKSRPVVVALEQPASDQPAIDAFLISDGGAEAKAAFLHAGMWNQRMKDGRSSEAMFRLFETLRQMRASGRITSVVAFQPNLLANVTSREEAQRRIAVFDQADYEKQMAGLVAGAAQPGAVVLVLTGGFHARLTPFQGRSYPGMAGHLPPDATMTFNILSNGGESWVCQGQPVVCGPAAYIDQGHGRPRGLQRGGDDPGYSGTIYLGGRLTASPPQPGLSTPG